MKLPDFIIKFARNFCNIKASEEDIFKFVRMILINQFSDSESDKLIEYINKRIGDI